MDLSPEEEVSEAESDWGTSWRPRKTTGHRRRRGKRANSGRRRRLPPTKKAKHAKAPPERPPHDLDLGEQALLLVEADWTKFWVGMGMTMQHYKEHLQICAELRHNHEAVLTGDLIGTNAAATTDEDEQ